MGLGKHKRNWSEAVEFKASPVSDYGISRWSQIVRLERVVQVASAGSVTMGLGKHSRPWSDAVHFYPLGTTRNEFASYLNMDRLNGGNPAGWSSIVQLPGDLGKHGRSWADAINFRPGNPAEFGITSWASIVNFDPQQTYTFAPIELDMSQVFKLGNRIQVDIGDIVDMGQLQGIITSTVNRSLADRKINTTRNSSHSPAGTNTGLTRSKFYNHAERSSPMGGNH